MNALADIGKLLRLESQVWEFLIQTIVSRAQKDGWSLKNVQRIRLEYVHSRLVGLIVVCETGDEYGLRLDTDILEAKGKATQ